MKHTITKGHQRGAPLLWDVWFTPNPKIHYDIVFGDNCNYNLDGSPDTMEGDDFDTNKLIGFGFLNFNKFPPHHYESVRVGWEWNPGTLCIDLYAYWYDRGERKENYLLSVRRGLPLEVIMSASYDYYNITIIYNYSPEKKTVNYPIKRTKHYPISYLLGPYFGGNRKAPHNMDIFITKLP